MLQEQQAQLQQMLRGLADTLKTMTAKIDEQNGSTRKGFADQKLVVDNIAEGVRVLREKADDTNVRLSTMTQEIESMRSAIQSIPAPSAVPPAGVTGDPNAPRAVPTPPTTSAAPPPNVSPGKAWDAAFNDYTSGQYDLAIAGFEFYIRSFPTAPACGRCAAEHRQFALRNGKLPGGGDRLPEGDQRLSARPTPCRRRTTSWD